MTKLEQTRETIANYGIQIIVDNCQSHSDDPDLMGYYDAQHNAIHIADNLTETQQLVTLTHELMHALHFLNNTTDPNPKYEEEKTLRETSQQLVSTIEYKIAESVYGTDLWHIADMLGVTVSVLKDWQTYKRLQGVPHEQNMQIL